MPGYNGTVVLYEPDDLFGSACVEALSGADWRCEVNSGAEEAHSSQASPRVVFLAVAGNDAGSIELIRRFSSAYPNVPLVLMVDELSEDRLLDWMRAGPGT